jgi:hypothetical protein
MLFMDFFPVLQADSWFAAQARRDVVHKPLFNAPAALLENAPGIAFAVVGESSVNYLQRDYASLINDDSLRLCLARLRAVLADLEWQTLPANAQLNLNVLVLEGNFHAAEALLLPERLQEAQSLLGVERLLVATPQRGQLLVAPYWPEQSAVTAAFASLCGELFAEAQSEAISPIVWGVRDGVICDRLASVSTDSLPAPEKRAVESTGTALFSLGQMVFVTVFGGLWAGLFALALNFRQLGEVVKHRLTLGAAVLSVPTVLAVYLYAPRTAVDRLFPLFAALGVALLAYLTQSSRLKLAFAHGAYRRRLWEQLLLITASLLTALILVTVVVHFQWL